MLTGAFSRCCEADLDPGRLKPPLPMAGPDMKRFIEREDRKQTTLLPGWLEDYIAEAGRGEERCRRSSLDPIYAV